MEVSKKTGEVEDFESVRVNGKDFSGVESVRPPTPELPYWWLKLEDGILLATGRVDVKYREGREREIKTNAVISAPGEARGKEREIKIHDE